MFGYHKMNGVEWKRVEQNEDSTSSFKNFRTETDKFFIPLKSEEKKYGK